MGNMKPKVIATTLIGLALVDCILAIGYFTLDYRLNGMTRLGTFAPPPSSSETPSTTGWTDDGATVRLTTNSDSVGIGTVNPDMKLTVNGSGDFNGNLFIYGGSLSLGTGTASDTLTVISGPKFGIGTSTPSKFFSISGDSLLSGDVTVKSLTSTSTISVLSTTASSTFSNGINLTGGCFSIGNVCLSTSGSFSIGASIGGAAAGGILFSGSGGGLQQSPATSVGGIDASSTAVVAGPGGTSFSLIPLMTEIASTTLLSAANNITLNNIPARNYLKVYFQDATVNTNHDDVCFFNSDTGANYSYLIELNAGGTISSEASTTATGIGMAKKGDLERGANFYTFDITQPSGLSKLIVLNGFETNQTTALDVSGAPAQINVTALWGNAGFISSITCRASAAANLSAGTRITVYGSSK